jgi:hypothetical protein
MLESREGTADVQKEHASPPTAVSETANPSVASAAATASTAGNRRTQKPMSAEHSGDKRFVQRHANAVKARAGHRRNIRRSNTNG